MARTESEQASVRSERVTLAGIQLKTRFEWPEVLKVLENIIIEHKARILVLPEHALYNIENYLGNPAETLLEPFIKLSAEYGVTIIPGTYTNPANGKIICPVITNGEIIAEFTKYSSGLPVVEIEGLTAVILICVEIERWQKQQEVFDIRPDLIINPALIRMHNNAALQYLGKKSYAIARQNAGEDLCDLASKAGCAIFRVDWAENVEEGFVGTTMCIDMDNQLIHTQQPSGSFIQSI